MNLEARWDALRRATGLALPEGHACVLRRYDEPHRAYHTPQHLVECLALFDGVRQLSEHPLDVELALWYHDAVYVPGAPDNEARSAALAQQELDVAGAPAVLIESVARLIIWTAHVAAPPPGDPALIVDIDLAIFAAPPERFLEYERQIRSEFAGVPFGEYRAGRARVLRAFLGRRPLYTTPALRARLEPTARRHLSVLLAALDPAPHP